MNNGHFPTYAITTDCFFFCFFATFSGNSGNLDESLFLKMVRERAESREKSREIFCQGIFAFSIYLAIVNVIIFASFQFLQPRG